jgi:RimJ/RimL family protein N-acetyltransferase
MTTAQFQSWVPPYPIEKARDDVERLAAMDGPTNDEWFGLVIADPVTDEVYGDVVMKLGWGGRSCEVGYTLDPAHRGKGYATEALERVLECLFTDVAVTRVHASLHPDNVASMRVLERCGFLYEGTARQAYWVGDVCTDDPLFGLLRADWEAWRSRPRNRPTLVELVEINQENFNATYNLVTHHSQRRFVAPMPRSFSNALVPERDPNGGTTIPWFRAVAADGVIVGFVMLAESTPTNPDPYLWRLLIDRMHQQRGIGTMVLHLLADRCRALGHNSLEVSWVEGHGSPVPFYTRHGFVPTGRIVEGETEARLSL